MESFSSAPLAFLVIIGLIAFIPYIAFTLFLNDFHKVLYGKGSVLIFIPFFFFQSYFLGKVCFNNAFGWGMVALGFVSSKTTLLGRNMTIIKDNQLRNTIAFIYIIIQVVLTIYAIIKFVRIKKQMKIGAAANAGNTGGQVPFGTINQTDPFAMQNPNSNIPPNQYNPQNSTNPNYAPNPLSNVADASSIGKLDPNITIDSIIHHAPDTTLQASANETLTTNTPTVETEIEVLDLNPTTELNQVSVDTNNPNNM